MSQFRYRALTRSGDVVVGEMTAGSAAAVIERLQDQGQIVVRTDEISISALQRWLNFEVTSFGGPSVREIAIIMHELATLVRASVPVDRALEILVRLTPRAGLRRLLQNMLERVRDGATLADALAVSGKIPKLYVSMIRAGEGGGMLEQSLNRVADFASKSHALRESVKSALVYPFILLGVAGATVVVVLTVVVPRFEPLFREAGAALPLATRILMSVAGIVQSYWWSILVALGVIVLALPYVRKNDAIMRHWHSFLLRLPLLGGLIAKIETSRFGRTLGSLVGNGVPLPAAVALTKETLNNRIFVGALGSVGVQLREGGALSDLLAKTDVFPELAIHLSRLGEETGRLEEMLLHQADLYDREAQRTIDRLMALFVPILTIGLGMLVAGIIMSVLAAILRINDLAG